MSLTEIKDAISELSEEEKCELAAWFSQYPEDDWDRQMKNDASAGNLDWMHRIGDDAIERGTIRSFP